MLNPYIESKYCLDGMFTSTAPVILMRFIVLLSNRWRQAPNVFCISALLFFFHQQRQYVVLLCPTAPQLYYVYTAQQMITFCTVE